MSGMPILTKFTLHLKQSLKHSFKLILELQQKEISPLSLLYGLLLEKGSVASELLRKENFNKDEIISLLLILERNLEKIITPELSPASAKILERAAVVALENAHRYIGTEHLLKALIESEDFLIKKLFAKHKNSQENLNQELENVLTSVNRFPEMTVLSAGGAGEVNPLPPLPAQTKTKIKNKKNQALEFFTIDLTNSENIKKMDPVIGRDKEINRLIQILCRRQKNNPVLLGDPGVGKTAIVEGLAQKIYAGNVPDDLLGKKVMRLDIGLLIAGTIYRGEFEGRLKQLLEEIRQDPNIIIFIDELHTIVGAGSASGTLDAANILKPALARGEIRCIGATTFEEFKKNIESDPALERRFQSIIVGEPSKAETLEILKGVAENYEKYHNLKINEDALIAAVELSDRYYPEKFFPDKALDVLDEASSAKKLQRQSNSQKRQIKFLEKELEELYKKKQQAVLKESFKQATKLKEREQVLLEEIKNLENQSLKNKKRALLMLTHQDVAKIVAEATGVPLMELSDEQNKTLLNLEEQLNKKIIGQKEIIHALVDTLKRTRVGLANPNKPLASFIFVGPSGVGKTELAKTLAELYFPSHNKRDNFFRIDMSEFGEGFHTSKLVGAPAGYVGYKEGNQLADKIKNHPYSVVLFDEIDKAHPDVFNIFLQILDEGRLTDAVGKKINFKNTIIIMTTNLGEELFKPGTLGFGKADTTISSQDFSAIKKTVLEELKQRFKTEFLNRLDRTLIFKPLTLDDLTNVVDLQLLELNKRLEEKNIYLEASTDAKKVIAQTAAPLDQGARAIYKVIQAKIEEPLADWILKNKLSGERKKVEIEKDGINIKIKI